MSEQPPLVSVVIPVYNREETIARCIDSALSQSYDNLEAIVVDDYSKDGTVSVIEGAFKNSIKLIKHKENKGGSAARNTGISKAEGKYIALLDSDDVWKPNKIKHQVKLLEARDERYIGSYTDAEYISQGFISTALKNIIGSSSWEESCSVEGILSLNDKIGGASTLLIKKSIVDEIGGFDPEFDRHQDYEFLIRCLKKGNMIRVPINYVIKFESNYADASTIEQSKSLFIDKFSDDISQLEQQGIPVSKYHNFDMARCHLRNGSLRKCARLLPRSRPSTKIDVFSFGKAGIDRIFTTIFR